MFSATSGNSSRPKQAAPQPTSVDSTATSAGFPDTFSKTDASQPIHRIVLTMTQSAGGHPSKQCVLESPDPDLLNALLKGTLSYGSAHVTDHTVTFPDGSVESIPQAVGDPTFVCLSCAPLSYLPTPDTSGHGLLPAGVKKPTPPEPLEKRIEELQTMVDSWDQDKRKDGTAWADRPPAMG